MPSIRVQITVVDCVVEGKEKVKVGDTADCTFTDTDSNCAYRLGNLIGRALVGVHEYLHGGNVFDGINEILSDNEGARLILAEKSDG